MKFEHTRPHDRFDRFSSEIGCLLIDPFLDDDNKNNNNNST